MLRIGALLCAALMCFGLLGLYNGLRVAEYTVAAEGVDEPIRLALIADLHSCAYGPGEQQLIDAIDAQSPDVILLAGDIFDSRLPDDNAAALLEAIGGRYPCYYVTGNHEYLRGRKAFRRKMAILEACGIRRLSGETAALDVKGARLCISGADDLYAWIDDKDDFDEAAAEFKAQLKSVSDPPEGADFRILLVHRPEYFDLYSRLGYGLVLAGHTHGGQWRIPGLVNGLFAPNQGLFPALAGGKYEKNGTVMIVSRGLARESTRLPRFYNRPELVIVNIQ